MMNGSLLCGDSLVPANLTPADLGPGVPGGAYTVTVNKTVLQLVNEVLQALVADTVPAEARECLARVLAVTAPVFVDPFRDLSYQIQDRTVTVTGAPPHNPFRTHDTSVYGGIR